jgi:hypothetical protein
MREYLDEIRDSVVYEYGHFIVNGIKIAYRIIDDIIIILYCRLFCEDYYIYYTIHNFVRSCEDMLNHHRISVRNMIRRYNEIFLLIERIVHRVDKLYVARPVLTSYKRQAIRKYITIPITSSISKAYSNAKAYSTLSGNYRINLTEKDRIRRSKSITLEKTIMLQKCINEFMRFRNPLFDFPISEDIFNKSVIDRQLRLAITERHYINSNINQVCGDVSLELITGFEIHNKTLFLKIIDFDNIGLNSKYTDYDNKNGTIIILCKNFVNKKIIFEYRRDEIKPLIDFQLNITESDNKKYLLIIPFVKSFLNHFQMIGEIYTKSNLYSSKISLSKQNELYRFRTDKANQINVIFDIQPITSIKLIARFMVMII